MTCFNSTILYSRISHLLHAELLTWSNSNFMSLALIYRDIIIFFCFEHVLESVNHFACNSRKVLCNSL